MSGCCRGMEIQFSGMRPLHSRRDIPNISTIPLALEVVDNILDLEMIAEKMNGCEWSYLFVDKIHPYKK